MTQVLESQDRRALYEIALVLAIAVGAIAGALLVATALPLVTIGVGALVVHLVAFAVIALVAD